MALDFAVHEWNYNFGEICCYSHFIKASVECEFMWRIINAKTTFKQSTSSCLRSQFPGPEFSQHNSQM